MNTAIMVIIVMGAAGITFGFVLAYANKKFAVEVNPLIHIVEDVLPKGQCGACGYAGCLAYAEAVVLNSEVAPNLCVPGKEAVAKLVAELTGKAAAKVEPKLAKLKCAGASCNASKSFNYSGIEDCIAASLLQGGPKSCKYGCIGFGTCTRNCPFGAITMSDEGLPIIDENKCTGCGKCEAICPKKAIHVIPSEALVNVSCNSKDKGAEARKLCKVSCLGCGICVRNCTHGALKVENNLAVVNTSVCIEKCNQPTCCAKCPTGAIKTITRKEQVEEGKTEVAATREQPQ
jgi:Na+-translocating ferredoxin:NAD+ oxidoreductase RNF subunit RnfB